MTSWLISFANQNRHFFGDFYFPFSLTLLRVTSPVQYESAKQILKIIGKIIDFSLQSRSAKRSNVKP
jgi:hypothetical protein